MNLENVNYNELFHRALADPSAVDSDTLSALIDHFPYAQSLRIAQARRNYPSTGTYTGDALLVTGLPLWLYGYTVTSFQPTEQNAAPADDATMEAAGAAEQPAHGTVADETGDAVTGTRGTEHEETRTGAIHIETVIPDVDDSGMAEHPAAMDYFTYEEQMVDDASASTEVNEGSQNMVPAGNATPHEKVSLYNDEHMPYSFLWIFQT